MIWALIDELFRIIHWVFWTFVLLVIMTSGLLGVLLYLVVND